MPMASLEIQKFYFFGGLKCVGYSFAYAAHFIFLRDVWSRTQRAAVASRRSTNLAPHLPPLPSSKKFVSVNFLDTIKWYVLNFNTCKLHHHV
jgi:hypothetical protein